MRVAFSKVERTHWFKPLVDENAELALIPSEAHLVNLMDPGMKVDRVCRFAFIDFKNIEDEQGKPLKNDLETRRRLYKILPIQQAVDLELLTLAGEVIQGEGDAASD